MPRQSAKGKAKAAEESPSKGKKLSKKQPEAPPVDDWEQEVDDLEWESDEGEAVERFPLAPLPDKQREPRKIIKVKGKKKTSAELSAEEKRPAGTGTAASKSKGKGQPGQQLAGNSEETKSRGSDAPLYDPKAQPRRSALKRSPAVSGHNEDDTVTSTDDEDEGQEEANDKSATTGATPALASLFANDDANDTDSSLDEVGYRNRIGDVPLKWYEKYDHIGYDILGQKIMRPEKSALEQLLERIDDPQALRTIFDPVEHESIRLSDHDLTVLQNILTNRYPSPDFDPYPDMVEYVKFDPWHNPFATERPKASFLPDRKEMKTVQKMMKAIKKMQAKGKTIGPSRKVVNKPYLMWDDLVDDTDPATRRKLRSRLPPPPMPLPSNRESYNPPDEYLPTVEDKRRYKRLYGKKGDRPLLVQKFKCLRHVPAYPGTLFDRYRRCLDLFDVPRTLVKKKFHKNIDKLLPKLPAPADLRPYPCRVGFEYKGHNGLVHSIAPCPNGQWLATGCDDCMVRIFEVTAGKLVFGYKLPAAVTWVGFCPNAALNILAAVSDNTLYIFVPPMCSTDAVTAASITFLRAGRALQHADILEDADPDEVAEETRPAEEDAPPEATFANCLWKDGGPREAARGLLLKAIHGHRITSAGFHHKGDYMCTQAPGRGGPVVLILSKRESLRPFRGLPDDVQTAMFFPSESTQFAVVTRRNIRVYDLIKQEMIRKLRGSRPPLMCAAIHGGEENRNMIAGSFKRCVMWYDMDWGARPYRTLTTHKAAVRAVAYHPKPSVYPLFASASDDGQVHAYHGTVFNDYNKNPLIVPLKILKGHRVVKYLGVHTCVFHPSLPWIFTGGADGRVICWTE
eukprot:NODE_164_length_2948_cov_36.525699_g84_i1.p1 GENE.NODE_164_length_2948_cov_36.525699_g84_i1~~NODE_164_length_2948_cov_36.525699_g84_i1.p1  ORF type:complete len:852 (-),score=157.77 NODE_164_length_2948_cov_36.525699_g84_i1:256-2811(-)